MRDNNTIKSDYIKSNRVVHNTISKYKDLALHWAQEHPINRKRGETNYSLLVDSWKSWGAEQTLPAHLQRVNE